MAGACTLPHLRADPVHEQRYTASVPGPDTSARDSSLVVQVRGYDRSGSVAVLAWDLDEPEYGLRATVSRNGGTIVSAPRFGNHELYLSPTLVNDMGGFRHAAVLPGAPLVPAPSFRDAYSCSYGEHCSPMEAKGVWIPDEVLRSHHDSLVVTFKPQMGEDWELTLSADLIDRYLHVVDSVSASLADGGRTRHN
jgi:hypothetical protein